MIRVKNVMKCKFLNFIHVKIDVRVYVDVCLHKNELSSFKFTFHNNYGGQGKKWPCYAAVGIILEKYLQSLGVKSI